MQKDIASIAVQFPEIANDIILPMMFGSDNFFSSVLRIGSPNIRLWTHYDVRVVNYDNVHVIFIIIIFVD